MVGSDWLDGTFRIEESFQRERSYLTVTGVEQLKRGMTAIDRSVEFCEVTVLAKVNQTENNEG